jgi:hypothetical protein
MIGLWQASTNTNYLKRRSALLVQINPTSVVKWLGSFALYRLLKSKEKPINLDL